MPVTKPITLANGLVVREEEPKKEAQSGANSETSSEQHDAASGVGLKTVSDEALRGPNKSGRTWKTVKTEKASMAIYKLQKKTLGASWEKKQLEKQKLKEAKELQEQLLQKKKERIDKEQKRLAAKRKRKAENELKNAKVQVLSHPEKMKKMNKKQLRSVYKTRMGEDGVVRLVGAYE